MTCVWILDGWLGDSGYPLGGGDGSEVILQLHALLWLIY